MTTANELTSLAGKMNKVNTALSKLGVDMAALQTTAAAFQMVGGTAQVVRGLISAHEAYNAMKEAEAVAQLAKWGPYAVAVAGIAAAGAYAMGEMIERTVRITDDGAGIRAIGGENYGRRA